MRYFGFILILVFCCEAKYIPEDGIYAVCEKMPEYSGGMDKLEEHFILETSKLENAESGSVFVSFIVNIDGNLENVKVVKSINEQQDKLAITALKNTPAKWVPGSSDGKPVRVKMTYPVNFK